MKSTQQKLKSVGNKKINTRFCRCNCLWCFDDDHDDMIKLMQMGFSRLNSRQ